MIMAEYFKATNEMLETVKRIIGECHRRLDGAKIAVIMRDKAGSSKGRTVMATASIPTAAIEPLLKEKYSFVICIGQDAWDAAMPAQRDALVDHELCHCAIDDDGPFIRPHDLEEFADVIERRGFWRQDHEENAVQLALRIQGGVAEVKAADLPEKPEHATANDVETATAIVRELGRASTSMIQRRMRIGYTRAAVIMDDLERAGIVGPPINNGVREVITEKKSA